MTKEAKKLLSILTIADIPVAKSPYANTYQIDFYPKGIFIEFYSKHDAERAEQVLSSKFKWTEIHELTSYKVPRWALFVDSTAVGAIPQGLA